jgi:hypothetical protein
MTSLDADALQTDPESLSLLRDVLGTAPATRPQAQSAQRTRTLPAEPARPAMPLTRTTRRLGLVGSTALIAIVIAASPAKPTVPREDAGRPAATETSRQAPQEAPARSRPVRAVTRYAAVEADPLACPRTRRKLWVEGEGWVVRTVSRC